MLLFGLLWPHSVLNGNLFLLWNPIHTWSSWHHRHHPRFVGPQRLQLFGVVKDKMDPAFPLVGLPRPLGLPRGLLPLAWNDSYMAPGTWLAPFFFWNWKKNAEVLALCRGRPTFPNAILRPKEVVNLHLFWAFDVSRSGNACFSFRRASSPLAIAVYRSALDHGRIQRLQGRSFRRSLATRWPTYAASCNIQRAYGRKHKNEDRKNWTPLKRERKLPVQREMSHFVYFSLCICGNPWEGLEKPTLIYLQKNNLSRTSGFWLRGPLSLTIYWNWLPSCQKIFPIVDDFANDCMCGPTNPSPRAL